MSVKRPGTSKGSKNNLSPNAPAPINDYNDLIRELKEVYKVRAREKEHLFL